MGRSSAAMRAPCGFAGIRRDTPSLTRAFYPRPMPATVECHRMTVWPNSHGTASRTSSRRRVRPKDVRLEGRYSKTSAGSSICQTRRCSLCASTRSSADEVVCTSTAESDCWLLLDANMRGHSRCWKRFTAQGCRRPVRSTPPLPCWRRYCGPLVWWVLATVRASDPGGETRGDGPSSW